MCLIVVAFCRCCKTIETPSNDSENRSKSVLLETNDSLPHSDGSGPPSETGDERWTQHFNNYEQGEIGNVGVKD